MEGLSSQLQTLKYFVNLMLRSMARLRFEVSSKGARIGGNPESRLLWRICLLLHQSLKPRVVGQLRGNPTSFSTNSVTPSRSGTATSNLTITTGKRDQSNCARQYIGTSTRALSRCLCGCDVGSCFDSAIRRTESETQANAADLELPGTSCSAGVGRDSRVRRRSDNTQRELLD